MRSFSLLLMLALMSGCNKQSMMQSMLTSAASDYFAGAHGKADGTLEPIADNVFSFRQGWHRGLIIQTTEGWVVVDSFDDHYSKALLAKLKEANAKWPVVALIYSHHHLDHTHGGAVLSPKRVIAHKGCAERWADYDHSGVLPPTETYVGDQTLTIGGVEIRLLDMGRSHTSTLFSVHVPAARTVYAADLAFVHALPPNGMPDHDRPGLIKAIKRLAALDFDHYVPSHFTVGTKADVVTNLAFYEKTARLADETVKAHGWPQDGDTFDTMISFVADGLRDDVEDWHGYHPWFVPFVLRTLVGRLLGY